MPKVKLVKERLTLQELWGNPQKMCEFMGWTWGPGLVPKPSWYGHKNAGTMEVPAEEAHSKRMRDYLDMLHKDWAGSAKNTNKRMTWNRMMAHCLKEEFGLATGTLEDRIAVAHEMLETERTKRC